MFQPHRSKETFAQFCRMMIQNVSRPYADMELPQAEGPVGGIRRLGRFLRPNSMAGVVVPSGNYMNRIFSIKCRL
jgi:hypothetical protein